MNLLSKNYAIFNYVPTASNGFLGCVKAGTPGDGSVTQYNDGAHQDVTVGTSPDGHEKIVFSADSNDIFTLQGNGWSKGVAAHDDASGLDGMYYENNKTGDKIIITGGATVKNAGTDAPKDPNGTPTSAVVNGKVDFTGRHDDSFGPDDKALKERVKWAYKYAGGTDQSVLDGLDKDGKMDTANIQLAISGIHKAEKAPELDANKPDAIANDEKQIKYLQGLIGSTDDGSTPGDSIKDQVNQIEQDKTNLAAGGKPDDFITAPEIQNALNDQIFKNPDDIKYWQGVLTSLQNDQKTGKNDTNSEKRGELTGVTAEDLIRDQTLGIDFKNIKPYTPGGDYGTQRAKGALKAILNDHDVAFALKQPGNKLSFATLQALMNQHNQGYTPSINGESISDFNNIINAVNILLGNNNEGASKDAITAFFNTHGGSVSADDGLAWVNS